MIQRIQFTQQCSLINSRSFQERLICSGLHSKCAHLEAGKPYCIVPPPLPCQLSNSSQCSSFICGGYLHWKAKPRGPLEGSCRQLRNVHRLARLSLPSYCLLPRQCNLTTCCYRQYKWSFLSGVKRRRNYVIRSFGHLSQLLNVKSGSGSEEDITFQAFVAIAQNVPCKELEYPRFVRRPFSIVPTVPLVSQRNNIFIFSIQILIFNVSRNLKYVACYR